MKRPTLFLGACCAAGVLSITGGLAQDSHSKNNSRKPTKGFYGLDLPKLAPSSINLPPPAPLALLKDSSWTDAPKDPSHTTSPTALSRSPSPRPSNQTQEETIPDLQKTNPISWAKTREQIQSDQQHERKGNAYLELKQYQSAVDEYKQMQGSAFHMGDAFMMLKQYREAGEAYSKACLNWKAGEAFFQAGMLSESAAAYDREWQTGIGTSQLKLYDSLHHNHASHADALFQTGKAADAAKEFHKVAAAFQPDPTSLKAKVSRVRNRLFPNPYVGCETAQDFAAVDQARSLRDIDSQLMLLNPRTGY